MKALDTNVLARVFVDDAAGAQVAKQWPLGYQTPAEMFSRTVASTG